MCRRATIVKYGTSSYFVVLPKLSTNESKSQLAFLMADFPAIFSHVWESPHHEMRLFSITVVCIMVNLQLQLLKVAFHVVWIVVLWPLKCETLPGEACSQATTYPSPAQNPVIVCIVW
jgi:hypothetical protein